MSNSQNKSFSYYFFLLLIALGVACPSPNFLQAKNAAPNENVIIPGIYAMPDIPEAAQTKSLKGSSSKEDVQKFMGYELLSIRYLSLPYDAFTKSNIVSYFVDVGFLLLLFIPLVFLFKLEEKSIYNTIGLLLGFLFLLISVPSAFLSIKNLSMAEGFAKIDQGFQQISFVDAPLAHVSLCIHQLSLYAYQPIHSLMATISGQQDYITYPLLILLFSGALMLVKHRVRAHSPTTKAFIGFMMTYFFLWLFIGAGIIWYGFLIVCASYILMIKGVINNGEGKLLSPRLRKGFLIGMSSIWLFMAFAYRAGNYKLDLQETQTPKRLLVDPIIQYQIGAVSDKQYMDMLFPQYNAAITAINEEDESLVYSVGTFLSYFVKKNDERVFSDTFLDFFPALVNRFQDKTKIIQALKASGYKYIIVDLQLPNNDYTLERSLTRKFVNLLNTLYGNPLVEVIATDRVLKSKESGQLISGVFQSQGEVVNEGRFALFKIK